MSFDVYDVGSGLERAQASLLKALHYFCRSVTRNHTFGCCVSRPKRLSRCWWLVAIGDTVHIHGFGYRSLTLAYPYAAPHTRYSSAMTSSSNMVLANQPTGENRIMVFEDALARVMSPTGENREYEDARLPCQACNGLVSCVYICIGCGMHGHPLCIHLEQFLDYLFCPSCLLKAMHEYSSFQDGQRRQL